MRKIWTLILAFALVAGLSGMGLAEDGDGEEAAAICQEFFEDHGDCLPDDDDINGSAYGQKCITTANDCTRQGQLGIVCFCKVMLALFPEIDACYGDEGYAVRDCMKDYRDMFRDPK